MTVAQLPAERRVVLRGVSWKLYQQMLAEARDGHTRFTYDQGDLEIMSPSPRHEAVKTILARLIEAYADTIDIEMEGFGSTTFDREDLQKGLESDECYYVQNAQVVKGRQEFDFTTDPPPDLAIEIDISPPDVARQPIYAALGVPEIWKYDGNQLRFLCRTADGTYVAGDQSLAFPKLPATELNGFLRIALSEGQSAAVRALRAWCRSLNQ